MAVTETSPKSTFVTVPGGRHSEVSRPLAGPVPQALSLFGQLGLWGNLGVSLLGFTGAIFVLQPGGTGTPELSLAAGLCAIVVGTLLGRLPVALAGLPGARTGAPICSFLVAAGATLRLGWLTALARGRGGLAAPGGRQVSGDVSA